MVGRAADARARDAAFATHIFDEDHSCAEYEDLHGAKSAKRSWTEHYLCLVAVSEGWRGADNLVQDNIVHYADPSMRGRCWRG